MNRSIFRRILLVSLMCSLTASFGFAAPLKDSEMWKQFRGNDGTAIAAGQKVPVNFGKENLRWSVHLPGPGSSSPVIWGKRLFVTSENREGGSVELVCLNAKSGKSIWSQKISTGSYHLHNFNNLASGTPCVAESRVVLGWYDDSTAHAMVSAYSHDGEAIWTQDLGQFDSYHGISFNPIASGDRVIVGNMHMGGGSIVAYSLADGSLLWSRPNPVKTRTSYAAPLIRTLRGSDAKEVVIAGELIGLVGLDFATGNENWSLPQAFNHRTITSPIVVKDDPVTGDVLIAAGNKNGVYFAARMPRISNGERVSEPAKVWSMESRAPYVPTPAVVSDVVYALHDGGTLSALDSSTGSVNWQGKLLGNFYASPVLVGDKLYCLSREGDMWVVEPGDEFKLLKTSSLNPPEDVRFCDATPAVAHNRLYVRMGSRLDCF